MAEISEPCESGEKIDTRLANLIPFTRGYDPRRIVNSNKGKKLRPSLPKLLLRIGEIPVEELGVTSEEAAALSLMHDAIYADDPNVRRQALKEIWDRGYGKALQPSNIKLSGSLDHTFTGRKLPDLNPAERAALAVRIDAGEIYLLPDGEIRDATFEDISEPENGDSSA
jgi:hypothetical protein